MNITELIDSLPWSSETVSAVSSFTTAITAVLALIIAYRTLHSWKDKEKTMQMIRLKRSIFSYRQKVESIRFLGHDSQKTKDYIHNVLQPALTDIFHEMRLAGMEERKCLEFHLFDALHEAQANYEENQTGWSDLLKCAVKLQESVKVSI